MALKFSSFISAGSGGGNRINGVGLPLVQTPNKGDFLVAILIATFGLTTPTPTQPGFTFSDDANNQWENLYDLFEASGSTLGSAGQISTSVWICRNATGKPISQVSFQSTVVPDAFNWLGQIHYSDWTAFNLHGILSMPSKVTAGATANPSFDQFGIGPNCLVITAFNGLLPGASGPPFSAPPTGFTLANSESSGPQTCAVCYAVRPKSVVLTPQATFTGAANFWEMAGLVIDITQPPLVPSQLFVDDIVGMPIEE